MKECWINVHCRNGKYWYGLPRDESWKSFVIANEYTIYRIHVRLK